MAYTKHTALWFLLILLMAGASVAKTVSWAHQASPYRAVFSWNHLPPKLPAGLVLTVPDCGMSLQEGKDMVCYDGKGSQVPSRNLGRGYGNTCLLLCRPKATNEELFVYFGSGNEAKQEALTVFGGVMAELWTLPEGKLNNWSQLAVLLPKAKLQHRTMVRELPQVANIFNSSDAFIFKLRTWLDIPQNVTKKYFVAADDAGYLLIDGKLLVERNGRNYVYGSLRGEYSCELTLTPGLHEVELVGVNFAGNFALALGDDQKGKFVHAGNLLESGEPKLERLEARSRDLPLPFFTYRHVSYMAVDDCFLTETELATVSGQEAEWRFSDGLKLQGSQVKRIFPGLDSREVKVKVKDATARGTVEFPEAVPKWRRNPDNPKDYQAVADLLERGGLKRLSGLEELQTCRAFYKRSGRREELAVVCENLLKEKALPDEERLAVMLELARSASDKHPEKSLSAYQQCLEREISGKDRRALVAEACEFLLFRLRKPEAARKLLNQQAAIFANHSQTLSSWKFDLAVQAGEHEQARKIIVKMLEYVGKRENERESVVRGNALQEQVKLALDEGRLLEAAQALQKWGEEAPMCRLDGSFCLWRARLFRARGWLEGALAELEAMMLLEPMLPNLPEIEWERGEVYGEAQQVDKASEIMQKIVKEYPNHPIAAQAANWLKRIARE